MIFSKTPHTRETSTLLFDTKTLSHNKSYPASAEDLRKLLTRKLLSKNPETPPKYGIRGIPTLMLFKNGNVEATKIGAVSKSQLAEFIDSNTA